MNKENAAQFLPLIKALAEGKTLQIYWLGEWSDLKEPDFTRPANFYRVKPEPREFLVWIHNDGRIREGNGTRSLPHPHPDWTKIRVREILD